MYSIVIILCQLAHILLFICEIGIFSGVEEKSNPPLPKAQAPINEPLEGKTKREGSSTRGAIKPSTKPSRNAPGELHFHYFLGATYSLYLSHNIGRSCLKLV